MPSEEAKRMIRCIKDASELRKELAQADEFGESITLEFTGADLAVVVYSLALSYITEWLNRENGHRKVMRMISGASVAVLAQASSEAVDDFLNEVLGKQNPEEAGDGA